MMLFISDAYNVSISEAIVPGSLVTSTTATDADQDAITYAIVDGDQASYPSLSHLPPSVPSYLSIIVYSLSHLSLIT
jgi:hypothetical protein